MYGMTFEATSAAEWYCCVAVSERSAAERPGGNGSFSARTKAGMSTFSRMPGSMLAAILPRQIVVLHQIACSSSVCAVKCGEGR